MSTVLMSLDGQWQAVTVTRLEPDSPVPADGLNLQPVTAEALTPPNGTVALLPVNLPVRPHAEALKALPAIALAFDTVAEGRPYSQARQLRDAGYTGQLIATGAGVTLDRIVPMRAMGIDHFVLPDETSVAAVMARFSLADTPLPPPAAGRGYQPQHRTGSI